MTREFEGLPGAARIIRGLDDLRTRRPTPDAFLVATARTRLRGLGITVPTTEGFATEADLGLYAALADEDDPYYRYNALRRELVSFLDALEARRARERVIHGDRPWT